MRVQLRKSTLLSPHSSFFPVSWTSCYPTTRDTIFTVFRYHLPSREENLARQKPNKRRFFSVQPNFSKVLRFYSRVPNPILWFVRDILDGEVREDDRFAMLSSGEELCEFDSVLRRRLPAAG